MARPLKEGLDYFNVDIDIMDEDSINSVDMEHGTLAFGILMRLLLKIYRNGYYTKWTKKEIFAFSKDISVDIMLTETIVSAYINEGFFSKKLFEEHQILTSRGIQKRFIKAMSRRARILLERAYFLLNPDLDFESDSVYQKIILTELLYTKTAVNVNNNPTQVEFMHTESTQSKVKKSKVKERTYIVEQIINYLNEKAGTSFSIKTENTIHAINARFDDGYTLDDFKLVIDTKVTDWLKNPEMSKYLRPSTLFRPGNFENYLNEAKRKGENIDAKRISGQNQGKVPNDDAFYS